MKASKYNFFIETSKNEIIGYNAITAALAKIDDEHYREYKLIEQGNENLSNLDSKKKKNVYKNLERGNFIYDDKKLNENDVIATSYNINKYFTNHLNLTIAPTMACNFDCYYCYEKRNDNVKESTMGKKIEKATIDFVAKLLKEKSKLSVTWYGGEPLLVKDKIYRMSENFIRICEEKKCSYISSIVTNGYYLDKNAVDMLAKYNISDAQITLDGPKEEHDSRRFDKKKGPSFEKIIRNIKYAKDYFRIIIRANIDRSNIEKIDEFLNFFQNNNLTKNISVYPGRVSECNLDMGNKKDLLLSPDEYFEKEKEIMIKAINEDIKCLGYAYPHPVVIPCGAVNFNTFSIDPDGYVYKCWEVLGEKEESVFHISDPNIYSKNHLKWINWDPKDIEECRECKHLPICNGGCVILAMRGKKVCCYWKNHLDDMLEILASKYERDKKERESCSNG